MTCWLESPGRKLSGLALFGMQVDRMELFQKSRDLALLLILL